MCCVQAALRMLLFQKALRLSVASRTSSGVGTIVNLTANDVERLSQLAYGLSYLWTSPLQVGTTCWRILLINVLYACRLWISLILIDNAKPLILQMFNDVAFWMACIRTCAWPLELCIQMDEPLCHIGSASMVGVQENII